MSEQVEIVKWYTRARRFPQLIGRTPDGAKLPGGPYTITQILGAGIVLLIGSQTTNLWAHYGLVGNVTALGAVTTAVLVLLGRIPVGARNPIAVVAGVSRALAAPRTGRRGGRPVRLRRPHLVRHRVLVMDQPTPAAAPEHAPVPAAVPAASVPAARSGRRHPHRPKRPAPIAAARRITASARPAPPATPAAGSAPDLGRIPAPALSAVQALLASAGTTTRRDADLELTR